MIGENIINKGVLPRLTFVGKVITGRRKLDIIVSKNSNDSLCEEVKIKITSNKNFLFSLESLSTIPFKYSSIKSVPFMQGCL